MRRIYSAYTGTGSVYAAVATHGNYSSAYIPIFTYACSPLLYPETCQVLSMFYFTNFSLSHKFIFRHDNSEYNKSYLKCYIFLCEIYIFHCDKIILFFMNQYCNRRIISGAINFLYFFSVVFYNEIFSINNLRDYEIARVCLINCLNNYLPFHCSFR